MDRDQGHVPDPQISTVQSVSRWVSLLKGRPGSRVLGPACPTGNVQSVPVAVEAERDTAADEGHLLPIPVADKSSHASDRLGPGGDNPVLCSASLSYVEGPTLGQPWKEGNSWPPAPALTNPFLNIFSFFLTHHPRFLANPFSMKLCCFSKDFSRGPLGGFF